MFSNTPMLNLTPVSGSFPFQPKYIPLTSAAKVVLGSDVRDTTSSSVRTATALNGWFASKPPPRINGVNGDHALAPISSLPLSSSHSEIWLEEQKVYIRDLDTPFGTFVNNVKIKSTTVLKDGDIISLGIPIPRNRNTPSHITDEHLSPIIAKVVVAGVPS
ncbi:hypothetical protein BDZ94DRAFT_1272174 [Collybia nuda]|uniref:FHA domain-containing protein n=1 Tax=Collybia nuda TaxID=64659 RepID=A0A9P6CEB9_9AGAR|nr:hypothetical protein BDZ94DRAFT_1272174 [Collybia nuda]